MSRRSRAIYSTGIGPHKPSKTKALKSLEMVDPTLSIFARFATKIRLGANDCWLWTGSRDKKGYGRLALGRKNPILSHRFAYEYYRGPIPPGMDIDHLCRIPSCVNPYHLEPVTRSENLRRGNMGHSMLGKIPRRSHCQRGHALDEANTLIDRRGGRRCKACHHRRQKLFYLKCREAINEARRMRYANRKQGK